MATFGNAALTGTSSSTIQYTIMGGYFQMGATGGTADSITAMLAPQGGDQHVKCALYDTDMVLVPNGVTEERIIEPSGPTAYTFDFVGTKPTLVADAWYFICAWADLMPDDCLIYYDASGGDGIFFIDAIYGEYPGSGDFHLFEGGNLLAIYCTYGQTITLALADNIGLAESVKHDFGLNRSGALADTLTLSEALATQATFNLALADTLALSEKTAFDIAMYLTDTLALDEELTAEITAAIKKIITGAIPRKIGTPTPINIGVGM